MFALTPQVILVGKFAAANSLFNILFLYTAVHVHEKAVQMRAIAKSCNNASEETAQTNGHTQTTTSNNHQETNMQDMTNAQTQNNVGDRGVVVRGLPSHNDHSSSRECILGAEHLPDELEQNGGRIVTPK